jgi:SulP family sulfate permease
VEEGDIPAAKGDGFRLRFHPRLLDALKGYSRDTFIADLTSGLTVAFVALPLAMAFAIASGVRPEQGIVTSIVAGLIISALGGSRVQIGGPAGAFVGLLYAIAEKYGVANLLIATMLAGVLLFAMGALRMGTLIRFIPVSIVIGFTSGIAVIIAFSQLRDFLGLHIAKMPANFLSQVAVISHALPTTNPIALAIGAASLVVIALWPTAHEHRPGNWRYVTAKMPANIAVLIVSALCVWMFHLPVETLGSRFGGLPRGLPVPQLPHFDWSTVQYLLAPAISIALLGAIESLLCARVADGYISDRHDPNQELMAQGVANFAAPLFTGISATGTIARTMTNVRGGARTPIAGIVHSVTLFLVVLVLAPLAEFIPLAALSAILLWVGYNMFEWREFRALPNYSWFYRAIVLATFTLTVVFDLTVAVEVGLVLSSLFFIYRISSITKVEPLPLPAGRERLSDGRRVAAWRLFGSIFFGSVTKLETLLDPGNPLPDVVILDMHQVINFDTTGLDALEALHKHLAKRGGRLILVAPNEQPLSLLKRSGFLEEIGEAQVFATIDEALEATEATGDRPLLS